mmetsp:Transcript_32572/g.46977  ORF Transcript_32572/g.46977 Transcript_32572/m.46977 type:complete len:203 (+) Transcript_32572:430-1038(+)
MAIAKCSLEIPGRDPDGAVTAGGSCFSKSSFSCSLTSRLLWSMGTLSEETSSAGSTITNSSSMLVGPGCIEGWNSARPLGIKFFPVLSDHFIQRGGMPGCKNVKALLIAISEEGTEKFSMRSVLMISESIIDIKAKNSAARRRLFSAPFLLLRLHNSLYCICSMFADISRRHTSVMRISVRGSKETKMYKSWIPSCISISGL